MGIFLSKELYLGPAFRIVWETFRWCFLLILLQTAMAIIDNVMPNKKRPWRWVSLGVIADLTTYLAHAWRWNVLLSPVKRLSLWRTTQAIYIGIFANEILHGAPRWLSRPGAVVVEIGETQAAPVRDLAAEAGFDHVDVRPDLTGRDRVVVARLSSPDDAS